MSNLIPFNKTDNTPVSLPSGFDEFAEDEGLDLRHYWRVVQHYKWGILGLAFAVGLFTVVWAYSLQPVYRSTATLLIGGNEAVTVSSEGKTQSSFDNGKFLGTQIELLKSREVAKAVMDKLGAARTSILNGIKADSTSGFDWRDWVPQSWLERANLAGPIEPIAQSDPDKELLDWLRYNLSVQPVRDTSMVQVSFEATDPQLAASIANAFTRAYLDNNLKQRKESTTEASQWLQEQLEKSRQHVLGSVDSLQQYREEAGLVNIEGMHSVQTEQLKDRTASLSRAQQSTQRGRESLPAGQEPAARGADGCHVRRCARTTWIQDLRTEEQQTRAPDPCRPGTVHRKLSPG